MPAPRLMTDRILRLKAAKEDQGLSIQDIMDMLAEAGYGLSLSTVKRIFQPGSEAMTYREDTVYPLEYVLIINKEPAPVESLRQRSDAEAYLQQISLQKQVILSKQAALDFYYMRYEELQQISKMRLVIVYILALIICLALFISISHLL